MERAGKYTQGDNKSNGKGRRKWEGDMESSGEFTPSDSECEKCKEGIWRKSGDEGGEVRKERKSCDCLAAVSKPSSSRKKIQIVH